MASLHCISLASLHWLAGHVALGPFSAKQAASNKQQCTAGGMRWMWQGMGCAWRLIRLRGLCAGVRLNRRSTA
jgi:hypothetical protein